MSEPPPFSPTITLLTLSRARESELAAALKPLGLNTRKYGLLGHIRGTPGISFSELARRSRITVQSVHSAISGFVETGLVDDGTAHAGSASRLRITPAGEEILARAAAEVDRLDTEFSARDPELAQALRIYMMRSFPGS
ncbi:MarR family winged helix-turn-helix transcriptional regulator [Gordonia sp. GN26]